jgi:hypothetical protein
MLRYRTVVTTYARCLQLKVELEATNSRSMVIGLPITIDASIACNLKQVRYGAAIWNMRQQESLLNST